MRKQYDSVANILRLEKFIYVHNSDQVSARGMNAMLGFCLENPLAFTFAPIFSLIDLNMVIVVSCRVTFWMLSNNFWIL